MSYKETKENICPICDSPGMTRGMYDKDENEFFQIVTCPDCGFMGKQWYTLAFTCISTIDNKKITGRIDPDTNCPYCGLTEVIKMKMQCNNASCKFCCMGETAYDSHCGADYDITLEYHWVDDSQALLQCTTFEPREDNENG